MQINIFWRRQLSLFDKLNVCALLKLNPAVHHSVILVVLNDKIIMTSQFTCYRILDIRPLSYRGKPKLIFDFWIGLFLLKFPIMPKQSRSKVKLGCLTQISYNTPTIKGIGQNGLFWLKFPIMPQQSRSKVKFWLVWLKYPIMPQQSRSKIKLWLFYPNFP